MPDLPRNKAARPAVPSRIRGISLLLSLAAGYFLWLRLGGPFLPCPFRLVTGWLLPGGGLLCPGCGVTHMTLALARGDLSSAWTANPFLLSTLPFLGLQIFLDRRAKARRQPLPAWDRPLLLLYLSALLLFGIARNLA